MKKSNLLIGASVLALSLTPVGAHAEQHLGPNFTADLTLGALKVDGRDSDLWALKSTAGVGGLFIFDSGIKVKYDLIADFAGEINETDDLTWSSGEFSPPSDANDVYIRDARVIVISDYGAVLIAPRITAGHWVQLYGTVDIFEYNRFHPQTGDIAIFGQKEQGKDTLAYATPEFLGGFKVYAASLMLGDRNDENSDAFATRLMYDKDGLVFGIGHTIIKNEQLPTTDDYSYTTATASYDRGIFKVAATYERNSDAPTLIQPPTATTPPILDGRDFDSFALVGSVDFLQSWNFSAGYTQKDHDLDALDLEGTIANLKFKLSDSAYLFAEAGHYDQAQDNYSAGVHLSF